MRDQTWVQFGTFTKIDMMCNQKQVEDRNEKFKNLSCVNEFF